eukprot:3174385-Prymnesium_polylepis.1
MNAHRTPPGGRRGRCCGRDVGAAGCGDRPLLAGSRHHRRGVRAPGGLGDRHGQDARAGRASRRAPRAVPAAGQRGAARERRRDRRQRPLALHRRRQPQGSPQLARRRAPALRLSPARGEALARRGVRASSGVESRRPHDHAG